MHSVVFLCHDTFFVVMYVKYVPEACISNGIGLGPKF